MNRQKPLLIGLIIGLSLGVVFVASEVWGATSQIFQAGAGVEITTDSASQLDISTLSTTGGAIHLYTRSVGTGIYIDTSNNVGIGNASPGSYKLNVTGTANFTSDVSVGGYLQSYGTQYLRSTTLTLNKAATGWLNFLVRNTAGSETVMDLQNIGTISAAGTVTVATPTAAGHAATKSYVDSASIAAGSNLKSVSTNWGYYVNTAMGGNGAHLLTVRVTGNNSNWNGTFLVQGENSYTPTELWNNVKLTSWTGYNAAADDVQVWIMSNTATTSYGGISIVVKTNAIAAGAAANMTVSVNGTNASALSLTSSAGAPYTYTMTSSTNTYQIYQMASGNVGIGTATPTAAKLQVAGTGRFEGVLTVTTGGAAITGNSTIAGTLTSLTGLTSSGSVTFSGLTASRFVTAGSGGLLGTSASLANLISSLSDVSGSTGSTNLVLSASPTFTGSVTMPGTGIWNSSGNVGIGVASPLAKLDVLSATRSGTHPSAVKGLYVTGDFSAASDGVEFRHSNATQGIGFGFNSIYAAGTNANQDLSLVPRGTGNVGIGTSTPGYMLDVRGTARIGVGAFGTGAQLNIGNATVDYPGSSGWTSTWNSNIVLSGLNSTSISFHDSGARVDTLRVTAGTFYIGENVGWGTAGLNVGGGAGKIDAGTIDPPYLIQGKPYATYMASMTGVKEETTGAVKLAHRSASSDRNYSYVLDLANAEEGSDLWLFAQTINVAARTYIAEDGTVYRNAAEEIFGGMTVLLTPSFDGKTWYEKDVAAKRVTIYGSKDGEVSYRLTAPRFDYQAWSNRREEGATGGFDLDKLLTN